MLYNLPDGSIIALHTIVAITPVFKPQVQGNDISKLDTSPRFQIFTMGNQVLSIIAKTDEKDLAGVRGDLIEKWESVLTFVPKQTEKVN